MSPVPMCIVLVLTALHAQYTICIYICTYLRTRFCDCQVAAGDSVEVTIPIKPLVELGSVDIMIKCITQFGLDVETATVQVQVQRAIL